MATKKKRAASKKVGEVMHDFKRGQLKSGGSGKKVTNPKQAIAIGLSEARQSGADVPPPPGRRKGAAKKNSATKKTAAKKTTAKRKTVSTKKSATKKSATKKKR